MPFNIFSQCLHVLSINYLCQLLEALLTLVLTPCSLCLKNALLFILASLPIFFSFFTFAFLIMFLHFNFVL